MTLASWLVAATVLSPPVASAANRDNPVITINGQRAGPTFDGIGAISGGGGNSRYLIDYPPKQRNQILNYMFGPGGADLQLLKLQIGDDARSADGSEPSVEHQRGSIDCKSGYEWWLAQQAVARDPGIKLYGLQWGAPHWVGSVWSHADAHYVITWLNCAKEHGLVISYLGGWNEHGYNVAWYEYMRKTLDASGYGSVKIVAADDIPFSPFAPNYDPAKAWQVAAVAATDPALRASIDVLGAHDTCQYPTTGFACVSTSVARRLGLPLWESELGAMDANTGAPDMARSINNGYIQAGITGYLEWPLLDSIPPGLHYENRGLVTADQPQSGSYTVDLLTWAIAQTTQFVKPGWRYINGANGYLGDSGTYDAYEAPNKRDWSLVAENTGRFARQSVGPQTLTFRVTGGLATGAVHVWATDLTSAEPSNWFVREPDIHLTGGRFSYVIPPGYVVSLSSEGGQSHYRTSAPAPAPMTLPYQARPDLSNEAWGLASQVGAFIYRTCYAGVQGQCIDQLASQTPSLWTVPWGPRLTPYAIVGDQSWQNYTVSTRVLFANPGARASLIGRFGTQGHQALFTGYEADLSAVGRWEITRDSNVTYAKVIATGKLPAIAPGTWHAISLGLHGATITFSVDGKQVGSATDGTWTSGLAGIGSNWDLVKFDGLTVG